MIFVYSEGLIHCSVCVPLKMSKEEIESGVNKLHPTGIDSVWSISEDTHFKDGHTNPCPCEKSGTRQHFLMVC